MKYYFAPLEGITNYRYRKIHNKYFNGIDKYFIPFLNPTINGITKKEKREVDPKNNPSNVKVVPQIISKNPVETIRLINYLKELGYDEININLGCPSRTVVPKGKGGGMLKNLDYLDTFLNYIYSNSSLKISLKIRVGVEEEKEFVSIMNIINKYPVSELIIHPRTVKDYYSGPLHLNLLDNLETNLDVIYNGDIKSIKDIDLIKNRFPYIKGIMVGRGLISKPDMFDTKIMDDENKKLRLKNFYNDLKEENIKNFGLGNLLLFEKGMWVYLINYFKIDEKTKKKLFKIRDQQEFDNMINKIFDSLDINK